MSGRSTDVASRPARQRPAPNKRVPTRPPSPARPEPLCMEQLVNYFKSGCKPEADWRYAVPVAAGFPSTLSPASVVFLRVWSPRQNPTASVDVSLHFNYHESTVTESGIDRIYAVPAWVKLCKYWHAARVPEICATFVWLPRQCGTLPRQHDSRSTLALRKTTSFCRSLVRSMIVLVIAALLNNNVILKPAGVAQL